MFGLGKEGLLDLSLRAAPRDESAQQQMQRIRNSWSIIMNISGQAGFIPTATYTNAEPRHMCIPFLLGKRKAVEVFQSHDETMSFMYLKRLGNFL